MPEETLLYLMHDDDGRAISTIDRDEARVFAKALQDQTVTETTLGAVYAEDPRTLVRARSQYYWAEDLMTGIARGSTI